MNFKSYLPTTKVFLKIFVALAMTVLVFCFLIIPYFKLLILFNSSIYSLENGTKTKFNRELVSGRENRKLLIDSKEINSLVDWLSSESSKLNLKSEVSVLTDKEENSDYKVININTDLVGSFDALASFVKIFNSPDNQYLLSLERAIIKKENSGDQYHADILIKSYWLR